MLSERSQIKVHVLYDFFLTYEINMQNRQIHGNWRQINGWEMGNDYLMDKGYTSEMMTKFWNQRKRLVYSFIFFRNILDSMHNTNLMLSFRSLPIENRMKIPSTYYSIQKRIFTNCPKFISQSPHPHYPSLLPSPLLSSHTEQQLNIAQICGSFITLL